MKVFVVFDERGRITGTVISRHDQMRVRSVEGTSVHVIDKPDLDHTEAQRYVRDLHEGYRVDVVGQPKLVRRKSDRP